MDEFVAFLLIGLVLLGVMVVVFNLPGISTELETAATVYENNFTVAHLKGEKTFNLGSQELRNGVFFGTSDIKYHIRGDGIEDMTLRFKIIDANGLGPLTIRVNDKTVIKKNFVPGEYEIPVPSSMISNNMTIILYPESSMWQIWAPNIYMLDNVKIVSKSFSFNRDLFEFVLLDEYRNFQEARIDLQLDTNIGRLAVEINDKPLFSGFVENEKSIPISKDDLVLGINKIELIPDTNSRFTGTERIIIFYLAPS